MGVPKCAKFMARDINGTWWFFEHEPLVNDRNKWECAGQFVAAFNDPLPKGDWFDSKTPVNVTTAPTSAPGFLNVAAKHMADRAATYDQPEGERSMGKAVAAFNAITGKNMSESEGWLLMSVLKMVRYSQNPAVPHRDSLEDLIAYSALLAECAMKETT